MLARFENKHRRVNFPMKQSKIKNKKIVASRFPIGGNPVNVWPMPRSTQIQSRAVDPS